MYGLVCTATLPHCARQVSVIMCVKDFETILEANMITYSLKLVLEFAALIKLRLDQPDLPRPYRIPCGTAGLVLLFLPPTALTVLLISLSKPIGLIGAGTAVALGLIAAVVKGGCVTSTLVLDEGDDQSAAAALLTADEAVTKLSHDDNVAPGPLGPAEDWPSSGQPTLAGSDAATGALNTPLLAGQRHGSLAQPFAATAMAATTNARARSRSFDNACMERLWVLGQLLSELYKVGMGTFLAWFVPHHCVGHPHSRDNPDAVNPDAVVGSGFRCGGLGEAVTHGSILERASLTLNAVTFLCILVFYVVEFQRERWCIKELDTDRQCPEDHLRHVASERLLGQLRARNRSYYHAALIACVMTVANVSASVVYRLRFSAQSV
jgi:amino acid transporter